jgi:2-dehydro-3-deoxyphosphooctonate aldolase (KDO 8-P synthase)
VQIGDITVGGGAPLALISGLNVIEGEDATLAVAEHLRERAAAHGFPLIFKASVDKANRSSWRSFRGPGMDDGLRILARVKSELGLPILTDVHEPAQAKPAAEVADCLQVPAFLCRQTDLLVACAATEKAVNVKKGQFLAPRDMRHVVDKLSRAGATGICLTERGTTFGYGNLVVDFRGLIEMRSMAPVCLDATHSVQFPGGSGEATSGDRRMVLPLARAGAAVGIDALFVEVHPDPAQAPCDGPSQLDFESFEALLGQVRAVNDATRRFE